MLSPTGDQQQDRPAFGITFAQHSAETAGSFGPAEDARNFQVRGEPVGAHDRCGSGRVALVRAHQDGGQRIAAPSAAHFFEGRSVAGHSADRRKRFQMLSAGVNG